MHAALLKRIKQKQMVLKSYLIINRNYSNKQQNCYSTGRVSSKKNSPGRGPETNIF